MVVINIPHAVLLDSHITVTQFIILVDEVLLGSLVSLIREFLRLEEWIQLSGLIHLGQDTFFEQSTFDFGSLKTLVSLDDDFANFHLVVLVDIYIKYDLVFPHHVISLLNINFCILISLVVEVFLCEDFGTVNHVRCNLASLHDTEFRLHILTFWLLQAVIVYSADTRAQCEVKCEVHCITNDRVGWDSNLWE